MQYILRECKQNQVHGLSHTSWKGSFMQKLSLMFQTFAKLISYVWYLIQIIPWFIISLTSKVSRAVWVINSLKCNIPMSISKSLYNSRNTTVFLIWGFNTQNVFYFKRKLYVLCRVVNFSSHWASF